MADPSTHWSRISESGTILGMRFMLLMFRIFGRGGFRIFLYPVMVYYYLTRPAARAASRQFQQQIGPLLPGSCRGNWLTGAQKLHRNTVDYADGRF